MTRLSIGTGTASPFGRIRLRFSRCTGISSTSGRARARWIEAALEWPDLTGHAPRAFGKHDQRMSPAHLPAHPLDRRPGRRGGTVRAGVAPLDQYGAKDPAREVAANGSVVPVVAPGDRAGPPPQPRRQRGPDDGEVQVAGVVPEVDPLDGCVGVAAPLDGRAADQPARRRDGHRDHRVAASSRMRRVRRIAVATDPATTSARPAGNARDVGPASASSRRQKRGDREREHPMLLGHRSDEMLREAERSAEHAHVRREQRDDGRRPSKRRAVGGLRDRISGAHEDQHVRNPIGQIVEDLAGRALEPLLHRQHPVEEIAQQAHLDSTPRQSAEGRHGLQTPAPADSANAAPEATANPTPAIETVFGRTPHAASRRAAVLAHAALRVARTRRETATFPTELVSMDMPPTSRISDGHRLARRRPAAFGWLMG